MVMFTATGFVGPSVGPVVGGFINQYTWWRWTFYVLIIWFAIDLVLIAPAGPGDVPPRAAAELSPEAAQGHGGRKVDCAHREHGQVDLADIVTAMRRPFELLVFEPMCLNLCILSALLLRIVYPVFGAFGVVFTGNYGLSSRSWA
ncbi:Uu.00g127330.m01.CDS01 [Anthostomella pinea]|uniref:Uu.00g127330.m01.CDS01 n=1 Tax=Anthostomella pinea TaxID=933095 RepID=A0AAI8YHV6_9PEZI|nr:Uu.00g127330.m01.CDS01 [Anthostomella pinea]